MTPDRLRQMADAATQQRWEFADLVEDDGDHYPVVRTPENAWIAQGERCFTPDVEKANLRLIAALGPDAARLLADAMDEVAWLASYDEEDCGEEACPDCRLARKRRDLLARFAALGEDTT